MQENKETTYPEIITLISRYGDTYTLTKLNENLYKANLGEYYRIGYKNDFGGDIEFVDPSGGPFINVGCDIKGREVTSIISDKELGILIGFKG